MWPSYRILVKFKPFLSPKVTKWGNAISGVWFHCGFDLRSFEVNKVKFSKKITWIFQVDAINKEANDLEQGYGGDKKQEINDIKVNITIFGQKRQIYNILYIFYSKFGWKFDHFVEKYLHFWQKTPFLTRNLAGKCVHFCTFLLKISIVSVDFGYFQRQNSNFTFFSK